MYQLYYYPLNASMAPHLVLTELGVDFSLEIVDRKAKAQKSEKYRALSPMGRIPTLVHGGVALFESPAICMHLAEQHPSSNLMPAVGHPNRPDFLQWMMFLTNTLQAELMVYFYPEKHSGHSADHKNIANVQAQRIANIYAILDKELEKKTYLLGDELSICDYFLFMLCVWSDELAEAPLSFSNIAAYLKRLAQREAVITVCAKEGYALTNY